MRRQHEWLLHVHAPIKVIPAQENLNFSKGPLKRVESTLAKMLPFPGKTLPSRIGCRGWQIWHYLVLQLICVACMCRYAATVGLAAGEQPNYGTASKYYRLATEVYPNGLSCFALLCPVAAHCIVLASARLDICFSLLTPCSCNKLNMPL